MAKLLLLTIVGVVLIALGLTGMYVNTMHRLTQIEKGLKAHEGEITEHKRKIGILERRDMKKSDNVYLVTVGESDVKFPSKEGL